MKLNYWMIAKSIVCIVFGVGFVLMTQFVAPYFGMNLNPAGILMAQLFGAAFIFESIVLWFARTAPGSDPVVRAIILGVLVSNTIGFIVALLATLGGVMNALGWIPVVLYLVFALGFAYFEFAKSATLTQSHAH